MIEGLDKAILKMKKGEVAEIKIASKYAFAEETQREKATVPAGADVIYEVELVEVTNPKETYDMTVPEKIEAARMHKEKGNKAYKEGKFIRAIAKYEAALRPIDYDKNFDDDLKKESKEMKKIIWLNIAAVALKLKDYSKAITNCRKVLEIEPTNIKALYRRSQAYMHRSDFIEAERDIKMAADLEPKNKDVLAQLRKVKQVMKASSRQEAKLYSTMFQRLAQEKEPEVRQEEPRPAEEETMEAGPSGE